MTAFLLAAAALIEAASIIILGGRWNLSGQTDSGRAARTVTKLALMSALLMGILGDGLFGLLLVAGVMMAIVPPTAFLNARRSSKERQKR